MCRPNYAQVIVPDPEKERKCILITKTGEGSHRVLAEEVGVDLRNAYPFECYWAHGPSIIFQPRGNQSFLHEELPTMWHFQVAQERLERHIGTVEKLFDWLSFTLGLLLREQQWDRLEPGPGAKQHTLFGELARMLGQNVDDDRKRIRDHHLLFEYYYHKARTPDNLLPAWQERV